MSQPLELPDPVFDALSQAAAASGLTPVGWITAHLPEAKTATMNGAKTLADMFTGRTGRIASAGPSILSEDCGENFTDYLVRKRGEGRL